MGGAGEKDGVVFLRGVDTPMHTTKHISLLSNLSLPF